MTDTIKIADFVRREGISMTVEHADDNPNMDKDSRDRMDHWRCRLAIKDHARKRTMTVLFSMGSGHNGAKPSLESVLDCIASDSAGIENARDFDDWCSEYGYDTDSRKAERIYRVCERQAQRAKAFLGERAYETLLWHIERQ